MTRPLILLIGLIVMLSATIVGCGSGDNSGSATATATQGTGTNTAAATSTAAAGPYKVGYVGALSGSLAAYYGVTADGVKAAVDFANAHGGVNGRQIQLLLEDDQGDATKAVAALKKLDSQEQVLALTGGGLSSSIDALVPGIGTANLPAIFGPSITRNALASSSIFSMGEDLTRECLIGADYLIQKFNPTSFAVVGINPPQGVDAVHSAEAYLKAKGKSVVDEEILDVAATDATAAAQAAASKKPDAILICTMTTPLYTTFLQGVRLQGLNNTPIFGVGGAASTSLLKALNDSNFYVTRLYLAPLPQTAGTTDLITQARTNGVSDTELGSALLSNGWAIGKVLIAGLEKCGGSCDRSGLRNAIAGLSNLDVGVTGPVTFSASDHQGTASGRVYSWQNGAETELTTNWLPWPARPNY
jgi:branched-chain amino acid transport system substrate-binding protein